MKSTDAFELSPSSEEYRQSIISKIDDDIETVKNQLESSSSPNEHRKFRGKQDALAPQSQNQHYTREFSPSC